MKPIIVIPTYNERENISELVSLIHKEAGEWSLSILVVDSASPDGTAKVVRKLQGQYPHLYLLEQTAKRGLGNAYLEGMRWALERDFDYLITMDADFSHHPGHLNDMLQKIEHSDLVVGSRYIAGGELRNWPKRRRFLSQFANWYARTLTGLPFSDLTSGFHCFRTPLLRKILRYRIHAEGYAFLIELKFLAILQGARFGEIPIIFNDRTKGDSKISKRVILESILIVLLRSLHRARILRLVKQAKSQTSHAQVS